MNALAEPDLEPTAGATAGASAEAIATLLAGELDAAYSRRQRVLLGWIASAEAGPVLDVGCGLGFSLELARAAGIASMLGVDASRERLARARRSGARPLVCARSEALPLPSDAFGAVLASEVLEHVDDDRALLAELHRVLRPGGCLALSVPHAEHPISYDPPNALLVRLGRAPIRSGLFAGIWTEHHRLYRPDALRRTIEAAGFEVLEVRALTRRTLPFLHLAAYGIGAPLLERLPRDLGRRLDRSQPGATPPGWMRPLLGLARIWDRTSRDEGEPPGSPSVNLAVRARAL